jgi:excisionase family DNA binding protein
VTAARISGEVHQVIVVLGPPDEALIASLRAGGLAPIAEDGDVVIWGRPSRPLPTPSLAPPHQCRPPAGLLMTIGDAAVALGIGRSTVYELIAQGQLEVVHVGRSARVPTEALEALVERLRAGQENGWRRAAG